MDNEVGGKGNAEFRVDMSRWGMIKSLNKATNEFRHKDLKFKDEVRILSLKPGKGDERIVGVLRHERLLAKTQHTQYLALSYYWGDHEPTEEIHVINYGGASLYEVAENNRRKIFKIRPNLLKALKRIRHPEDEIPLWTDAICINQANPEERSIQVERMGEVYAAADEVFVWLGRGKSEEVEKKTFDDLKRMLDLRQLEVMIKDPTQRESWERIVDLMNIEWFSRRWVIQELALAKHATVHFGEAHLEWQSFARAVALFIKKFDDISPGLTQKLNQRAYAVCHPEMYPSGANILVDLTTHWARKDQHYTILQKRLTLEVLVSTLLPYGARNPRDTVYALLGIAKDTSRAKASPTSQMDRRLKPDYRKSVLDVCTDFMDYCIESSNSLDILCRNWAPPSEAPTLSVREKLWRVFVERVPSKSKPLPSWLPSLQKSPWGTPGEQKSGRKNADSLVGVSNRQNNQSYCASGDLLPECIFGKTEKQAAIPSAQHDSALPAAGARKRKRAAEPRTASRRGGIRGKRRKTEAAGRPFTTMEAGPSKTVGQLNPGQTEPQDETGKYSGVFSVKGIVVGTIQQCLQRAAGANIFAEVLEMFGWSNETRAMDCFEDFWRTLVADRGPSGISIPAWYAAACEQALLQYNPGEGYLNVRNLMYAWPEVPPVMKEFLKRVEAVIWGRRFIDMSPKKSPRYQPVKSNCFGLSPGESAIGDLVCVLFGCSVPVVLRRYAGSRDDSYLFIGECYIHGIMDGEAVQGFSSKRTGANPNIPGSTYFHLV